jgi:peptidoglycan/LPS O-acetylase OafA/YrhL
VLSGFVLTRTYLPRWREGMGAWAFMKRRFVRLYPLFLFGIGVTTLSSIARRYTGIGNAYDFQKLIESLPFNLLLLPAPTTVTLFPFNVPAWSLFFEMLASAALILVLFRLPRLGLTVVWAVCCAGFAAVVLREDNANLGPLWSQFGVTSLRTGMSFTAGTIIAGLPQLAKRSRGWLPIACFGAVIAMLVLREPAFGSAAYALLVSIAVSPLLVWAGARVEPPRFLVPFAWFLGEVSYGVYAVHWALMEPLRYFKDALGWNPALMGAAFLSCCVLLAWLGVRFIDRPMRRWLGGLLHARARDAARSAHGAVAKGASPG